MHILLVVPRYNAQCDEFYQFPLGLGYIAAALKQAGHRVTGLNLNHSLGAVEDLVSSKIRELDPDICASGTLAPFLSSLKPVFKAARKAKPNIINIAGGGMVSGEPEISMQVMDIDFGVVSEGEQTIVELLDCLEKSGNFRDIKGIVFRDPNNGVVQTEPRPVIQNLKRIAWPDYELLEYAKNLGNQHSLDCYFYQAHKTGEPRAIDMITSRSCPFSCTFCFHPVGKVYRERPLDDFFAELDMVIARYQIDMVALVDELFSLRKRRLLEFCERIKPYKLQWMTQLHVTSVCEETLKAMRDSGCSYISFGIESMSLAVLKSMQKKSTPERIASVLVLTYENRIGIQGNLLFGDKAETLETANESMHWWAQNRHYQINLTPLTVYPGSPDYAEALENGLIADRVSYVENIPGRLNNSKMSDKDWEMLGFQVWVFANTLLNPAPLKSFKGSENQVADCKAAYDIIWECPRCGHENGYLGVVLPPDAGRSLRLCCRNCFTKWDIENKAYHAPADSIDDATCITQLHQAGSLFEQKLFKESHDLANELLKTAPNFKPARLFMAKFYRHLGPPEHMLKSFGAALGVDPFNPVRHNDFADALMDVGAYGAAHLHYQQALSLRPSDQRAKEGMAFLEGPGIDDEQRSIYFVAWSNESKPSLQPSSGICTTAFTIIKKVSKRL